MAEERLKLNDKCFLIAESYINFNNDIYLEYIDLSQDPWCGKTEPTTIDIDRQKAIEIINLLQKYFNL